MHGKRIISANENGSDFTDWQIDQQPGCLALCANGALIAACEHGFHRFYPHTGTLTKIGDPEADKPDNRFNDGACDRQGRLWAGTMRKDVAVIPVGSFYRLDHDLGIHLMLDDFMTTNGTAFSPDGTIIYLADTKQPRQSVWAFDYDIDDGSAHNRRLFLDCTPLAGRPDGACVDADGCYWVAGVTGSQLYRVTPKGDIDMTVDLPIEKPSKPTFGGKNLDTLYVTSIKDGISRPDPLAGAVLAITGLGITGLPEPIFQG
ncbi:MAG: SMP-30/gluconolactonase/LRE family protein [Pseudomonadota bacterium]